MATPETKLPLKLLVDSKTKKVIFAEAGSEIVDLIFGFLTLPLATIIRQLEKHCGKQTEAVGCFNNLYASLENLNDCNFSEKRAKNALLHPNNAFARACRKLKLKIDDSEPTKYYCTHPWEGVFTNVTKKFIISDDLRVFPSVDGLNFELIQNLVGAIDAPEEKILDLGLNEVLHLLNFSITSDTPLTILFNLKNTNRENILCQVMHLLNLLFLSKTPSTNFLNLPPKSEIMPGTEFSTKFVVKALIQKSSNKLLFFLAGGDFVEFLFRLLAIPLGSVLSLSGGHGKLGSIGNLYSSISELSHEYLNLSKSLLMNPQVAFHNVSNNTVEYLSFDTNPTGSAILPLADKIVDNKLISGSIMFVVTDDLVVSPMSSISLVTLLRSHKIAVSDVQEVAIDVRGKEGLDILWASVSCSTKVLSYALWSLTSDTDAARAMLAGSDWKS